MDMNEGQRSKLSLINHRRHEKLSYSRIIKMLIYVVLIFLVLTFGVNYLIKLNTQENIEIKEVKIDLK